MVFLVCCGCHCSASRIIFYSWVGEENDPEPLPPLIRHLGVQTEQDLFWKVYAQAIGTQSLKVAVRSRACAESSGRSQIYVEVVQPQRCMTTIKVHL